MSDVREQMFDVIQARFKREGWSFMPEAATASADAILERFDVVEKPVVTDEALGGIVQGLGLGIDGWQYQRFQPEVGRRLSKALEAAGLRIVKAEQS